MPNGAGRTTTKISGVTLGHRRRRVDDQRVTLKFTGSKRWEYQCCCSGHSIFDDSLLLATENIASPDVLHVGDSESTCDPEGPLVTTKHHPHLATTLGTSSTGTSILIDTP